MPTLLQKLQKLVKDDVEQLARKDKEYGSSWKRRGGIGAYMMLARKWDRIENHCKKHNYDVFETIKHEPSIIDDIIDLGCYLLLVRTESMHYEDDADAPVYDKNLMIVDEASSVTENDWSVICDRDVAKRRAVYNVGDSELLGFYDIKFRIDVDPMVYEEQKSTLLKYLHVHYKEEQLGEPHSLGLGQIVAKHHKIVKGWSNPMTGKHYIFTDKPKPNIEGLYDPD